jgi:phosphatidylserine/phosphatidylglycerophosphate/cardiolipin synthase-like enzyme
MADIPSLAVELFADLNGASPDFFAQHFLDDAWPDDRPLPVVYFDPRSGPVETGKRASLHAKLVTTDSVNVFVTSANFTERAHSKNVEAGLLVRSRHLGEKIESNFRRLIDQGLLQRLKLPVSS